ncbi:hypothetical protein BKA63DRAFT_36701 [Paraphoma chrysanthemicola]|nr:hypothetical protein BKA63DRAFT_36701 [Paraphoma chrysanthemicola]
MMLRESLLFSLWSQGNRLRVWGRAPRPEVAALCNVRLAAAPAAGSTDAQRLLWVGRHRHTCALSSNPTQRPLEVEPGGKTRSKVMRFNVFRRYASQWHGAAMYVQFLHEDPTEAHVYQLNLSGSCYRIARPQREKYCAGLRLKMFGTPNASFARAHSDTFGRTISSPNALMPKNNLTICDIYALRPRKLRA